VAVGSSPRHALDAQRDYSTVHRAVPQRVTASAPEKAIRTKAT